MTTIDLVSIIGGVVGAVGVVITLINVLVLTPANRQKILTETRHDLITIQGDLQRQITELSVENERLRDQIKELVKENDNLRSQREKDYIAREKERDGKKREYDVLQDRLSNFESRHIQMLSELEAQRANSRINQLNISALELQSEKDKVQKEKDKIVIQQLKDEVRRLKTVTGNLEATVKTDDKQV